MCGIAGILSNDHRVESETLTRMTDAIAHRGPDGAGHWINAAQTCGLGHRRLAIIDLSETGRQPMFYADGRYSITYNGEIYNYLELRHQLESRGVTFVSTSDTEVLLALFAESGAACLGDLEGMFAFAIWDDAERRLFIARDRFGEKPFYYSVHNNALYFGSEMKTLWAAGVPRSASETMLFDYLDGGATYDHTDLSRTFFEGIFKLKAAHYAVISPDDLRTEQICYWRIDPLNIDAGISEDDAKARFIDLFDESVAHRLRSDVAVGSSLSGGLDSSLIVCTIDKLNERKVRQATFSARFPGFEKDEGEYMQAVIDATNVEPHFAYPDGDGLIADIETLCHHQEEPFGTASIYAQFCVMRLAKDHGVTVLLDGQGADELLAGYHTFFDDYLNELRRTNLTRWRAELNAYAPEYGAPSSSGGFVKFAKAILPRRLVDFAKRLRRQMTNSHGFLNRDFYEANFASAIPSAVAADTLQAALYRQTFGGSLEELLRYADRNSMAHSREVRLPFLHHGLAEFLFSLPSDLKIRKATTKYIMRETFRDRLPQVVVNRRDKIGYEPPQKSWLSDARLAEMIDASAVELVKQRVLAPGSLTRARAHDAGRSIFASQTWKILMAARLFD